MNFKNTHQEKRENLNKNGIYIIYHILKPDYYYVGSAASNTKIKYNDIGFLQRWRNHFSTLKKGIHFNPHLQNTINKHGIDGLRFKIVEFTSPEDCILIEDRWLQFYIKNHKVYNVNKIHPTKLGYVTSEETKLKISQNRIKKKIYQFDFKGNLIKEWLCLNHVLKEFPTGSSSIWRCLNNLQQTSNNYIWSYNSVFEFKSFNRSKPVMQYDLNGNFIKEWKSAIEAEKELNIFGVNACCNNKRKTAAKYIWEFKAK